MSTSIPGNLAPHLNTACARYGIDTPLRRAHFFAQCAHESAGFTRFAENLNYSAEGLRATWPNRFDLATAQAYAHKPQNIASKVYAGRLGNGDEASGDGWTFRGRGLLQVTGKANYAAASKAIHGSDLFYLSHPEVVEAPEDASLTAAWFWSTHDLNAAADRDDIVAITKTINGGLNGLDDRKAWLAKFKA